MFLLIFCLIAAMPLQPSEDTPGRIIGGSPKSPIRIDVFSDFQCSACRELYLSTIRPVLSEYSSKDQVCIVYHEFPLAQHPYAQEASRYCEAVGRMGLHKTLAVMESIFIDQANWAQDGKLEVAVAKVLTPGDFAKLKQIMKDSSVNAEVQKQIQLGIQKKVQSTPTLFIQYPGKEQKVEGLITYPVMKQFIDSILKKP